MWPAASPRFPVSPAGRGGTGSRLGERLRHVARDGRDAVLQTLRATDEVALADVLGGAAYRRVDDALVALGQARDLVPALTQLTLELRPRALELTLELVAGAHAAALVLAHVHVRLALELLHLALGGRAARVRTDRLDDVVPRGQRGADAGERDTLDLL